MRLAGRVVKTSPVGPYMCLTVDIPGWKGAEAGQFAMVQSGDSHCFLARPYSVSDDESVGEMVPGTERRALVRFLVDVVGSGSRELAALHAGDGVHLLGPLGRGFAAAGAAAPAAARRVAACPAASVGRGGAGRLVIVAGGVGIAPLPLVLREIRSWPGVAGVLVVAGFHSSREAVAVDVLSEGLEGLRRDGVVSEIVVASEDGSVGVRGLVTDALERELQPQDAVLVCGPDGMSRAVWQVCRARGVTRAWFSLEAGMACGVGSCHGCVTRVADGSLARVCRNGPVFTGEEAFGNVGVAR